MVDIEVKLPATALRALRAQARPEPWLGRAISRATLLVARRIERQAKRQGFAPVRTGGGRRSIEVREVRDGHAIVSDLHMLVMEEGRAPGGQMPPVAPLERWGRRVLKQRGLGFVLARSIQKRGIKPRRYFARAIQIVTERERGKLDRDVGRIVRQELRRATGRGQSR